MAKGISLLRLLTDATGLPRRRAFAAIREGRLAVAGVVTTDPSAPYAGGSLTLDGAALPPGTELKVYLLLHKPPGVITAAGDARGRPTVLDLLPPTLRTPGLHPVGRLDRDTTGLLLLTNDGTLTHRLTHPRFDVEKEYWVRSLPSLSAAGLERLRRGVDIDGVVRAPVAVEALAAGEGFDFAVTLREGRKRQVRRMVEAAGSRVIALRRVREGPLRLGGLPEGRVRRLSRREVHLLRAVKATSASGPA